MKSKSTAKDAGLCVVLVSTRNPLNIGAAARAVSNFGFERLRLVNPCDPAFREARSAVGAAPLLRSAEVYSSVAEAIADCSLVVGTTAARARELHQPLRRLEVGAMELRKRMTSTRVALMFGSEKRGLLNEELSYCHWLMRIPTREGMSMNLGQAVAVCLYELVREAKANESSKPEALATSAEIDRITSALFDALQVSGYVNPTTATSTEEKIRRLVRRTKVPSDDAEVWLGMLRQILWKLRK